MGHRHVIVKKLPAPIRGLPLHGAFSLSKRITGVDPRGLEPLASAMRSQHSLLLYLLSSQELPLFEPDLRHCGGAVFCSIPMFSTRVAARLLHTEFVEHGSVVLAPIARLVDRV